MTFSLYRNRLPPSPHYVLTLLIGFARISESSPGPVGGQLPPFVPRGIANGSATAMHASFVCTVHIHICYSEVSIIALILTIPLAYMAN